MQSTLTKPCIAQGHRECVRGFHTEDCHKCTRGSGLIILQFCFEGRRECNECFGLGHTRRICQPCIKEHYRGRTPKAKAVKKVKSQLEFAQEQFSKSVDSLTNVITSTTNSLDEVIGTFKWGNKSEPDVSSHGLAATTTTTADNENASTPTTISPRPSVSSSSSVFTSIIKRGRNNLLETHRRKWSWSSFTSMPNTSTAA
ncbi:hypothetical protein BCR41DRAFT_356703 [Lobosporangium transversale]|uniref:Uncharacterized protein n=1 Tax=Lobosporangium transversale TaxID=64571 RepID=A0A1Y2GLQ3_9FUNG|nr:hypothetical protein BCR41DRAFT_357400 [Lobosporangium transversale]XP_021879747.1 hypothetical protein BCR41DRAFT_356703 [Lobosporangium transversale]ORZ11042.1 hypothetical protein BCR41DRAFT_357400 [Lobosporangium transversale]ORZ11650.1 hypothetical protein BCR41DRAFT_356703 [Lobosporangium transversale]|eukprot:XP_021879559.1 hypothetical protein BCR41DRAFT_357400 [Lobosporangium transversale]